MARSHRPGDIEEERQYLRKDHAVEDIGRNALARHQIADERRLAVASHRMEHVRPRHAPAAKLSGIGRVPRLQHASLNGAFVGAEEILDLAPIDRCSTVGAEDPADGTEAA